MERLKTGEASKILVYPERREVSGSRMSIGPALAAAFAASCEATSAKLEASVRNRRMSHDACERCAASAKGGAS